MIGELVMEALASLDQVAYIRFASVYRNFREAKDFGEFVGQITADDDRRIVSQLVPPLEGRVADIEMETTPRRALDTPCRLYGGRKRIA
jgi:hypothetical protein